MLARANVSISAGKHTFYSYIISGLLAEYYDRLHSRTLGRPRFHRYVLGCAFIVWKSASALMHLASWLPGAAVRVTQAGA